MTLDAMLAAARPLRAVCLLALLATGPAGATESVPAAASEPVPAAAAAANKPLWGDLTPAQQQALAPLAPEWNRLDAARKQKWINLGNKFASMNPGEQDRVQARMREWVNLTPEQRRMARESYTRAKKMNPDQKSAHWQKYQQLSEEQKKKLAADAASRKPLTAVQPPSHNKKPAAAQTATPPALAPASPQPLIR